MNLKLFSFFKINKIPVNDKNTNITKYKFRFVSSYIFRNSKINNIKTLYKCLMGSVVNKQLNESNKKILYK